MNCRELFRPVDVPTAPIEVACPNCGTPVQLAVGRFAGIVSVVRFIAALGQPRRAALIAALQPERTHEPPAADKPELGWLTDWLTNHDVATSTFWRRCLILAIQLTPNTGELTEPRLLATAREVARQAGTGQSFTPRRY
jgi:hypothetical protein